MLISEPPPLTRWLPGSGKPLLTSCPSICSSSAPLPHRPVTDRRRPRSTPASTLCSRRPWRRGTAWAGSSTTRSTMAEASGSLKSKFCSSIPRPPCQSSRQLKPLSHFSRGSHSLSHFRLGPQGPEPGQPALTLQLDKFTPDRQLACYNNGNCNSYRYSPISMKNVG